MEWALGDGGEGDDGKGRHDGLGDCAVASSYGVHGAHDGCWRDFLRPFGNRINPRLP